MNKGWRWLYGPSNVSIVLKKDILKDLRFRVCEGFSFGCEEKKSYMNSSGNLKRKPNMKKIQDIINEYIEKESKVKKIDHFSDFMESHEVLFFDNIPLNYISFIIVKGEYYEEIKNLFPIVINYDDIVKYIKTKKRI